LNVTPESADTQRHLLLRYVEPRYYGEFNNELIAERDRLVQQHMSTVFYPVAIQVDTQSLSAEITGDLISSVGSTQLAPQRVTYFIHYRYNQGRLLINQFQEVKPHEN